MRMRNSQREGDSLKKKIGIFQLRDVIEIIYKGFLIDKMHSNGHVAILMDFNDMVEVFINHCHMKY
jgi:hypothetical protein